MSVQSDDRFFTVLLKIVASVAIMMLVCLGFRYIMDIFNGSNDFGVVYMAITALAGVIVAASAMKALWWPSEAEEKPWPPAEDPPKK